MSISENMAGNLLVRNDIAWTERNIIILKLRDTINRGRAAIARYPLQVAVLAFVMAGLASVNVIASKTLFEPISDTVFFQLLLATNELLALALALYAAYRWDTTLGMIAILIFLSLVAPFLFLDFVDNFPKLLHLQLVALITLFGIWLIGQLQLALRTTQQREREIRALAGLNAQVLNERAQLLEEASKGRGRLASLLKTVSLSSLTGGPAKAAEMFLGQIRELIDVEFASFTMINSDGSIGERIDNFKRNMAFPETKRPSNLEQAVVKTWAIQYVTDADSDERCTPALLTSGICSYLGLPVKTDRRLVGILCFYSLQKDAFRGEKEFLESISGLLAGPIMRAELCNDIEYALQQTKKPSDTSAIPWR